MGFLCEGEWSADEEAFGRRDRGRFVRQDSSVRDWIRANGSTPFRPEKGRYHLYVSLACPWAHRTLLVRTLKRLEDVVSCSAVAPVMRDNGWEFVGANSDGDGGLPEVRYLWEIYRLHDEHYTGRATTPVLWDRNTQRIVNNESAEIIRMLNSEFSEFSDEIDLYPPHLRAEIDETNEWVYERINNGVYRCGFATTQEAYEEAFDDLFDALERVERILSRQRYLVGEQLTEADWRLFPTLVRFDPVYFGHFKCNKRRMSDYPNLFGYLRELYQVPGVARTVDLGQIKRHYYASHRQLNPSGVVPVGPDMSYLRWPHVRDRFRHAFPVWG